ncbi:MAG: NAD(P)(+) transhydrogenase (Re/Si-specific) subunit beta [Candidatus Neomarinimicrobiota bacterium]
MEYTKLFYVLAAVLFILGLKKLSHPKTARNGNIIASIGMLIAILVTLVTYDVLDYKLIAIGMIIGAIIGSTFAIKVKMTGMPQMVAIFNGFGGGASALVAAAEFYSKAGTTESSTFLLSTIALSVLVGTLTFTGSFIAFGKLQGFISGQPIVFKGQKILNAIIALALITCSIMMVINPDQMLNYFLAVVVLSALLGITIVIPIGGADMPVVISLLNSYSGIAAAATGFVLLNNGLIISGALVGASGLILTNIMCKGMNRSLANVIFGAVGLTQEGAGAETSGKQMNIKSYSTEEAAMIFDAADKIILVPGYGLAVAQAQHAARELADFLESKGKTVLYAIHPVAGRMPGHMNVLLAEANVPYEQLKDLDQINPEFETCDVALVLGANDVVNPAARHDKTSPIYGMPILDVDKSRTVIINKRTMNPGFAGIQNELFGFDNTIMVFGDAKQMLTDLLKDLKDL